MQAEARASKKPPCILFLKPDRNRQSEIKVEPRIARLAGLGRLGAGLEGGAHDLLGEIDPHELTPGQAITGGDRLPLGKNRQHRFL